MRIYEFHDYSSQFRTPFVKLNDSLEIPFKPGGRFSTYVKGLSVLEVKIYCPEEFFSFCLYVKE